MFQKFKENIKNIFLNVKEKLKTLKLNSFKNKTWLFLISFSILILIFLWLFQTLFLGAYYKFYKTNDINSAAKEIEKKQDNLNINKIDKIAKKRDLCIELYNDNSVYTSNIYNQGCIELGNKNIRIRNDFVKSGLEQQHYKLINKNYENEILIYALKLNNGMYAFINASIEPLDSTISILTRQFAFTSFIVIILSLILGYIVSKSMSKPLVKLSNDAKKVANGNYNVSFETDSKIYEINQLSDSLNYAKTELSKTENLKKDLLANVGHDLKTPLTMIKAYAEMIRDINYDNKEKMTENLNTIIEETDRLALLVNDIVDLSALQAKAKPLNRQIIDLNKIVTEIINRFKILSEKENYHFIFNHPESVIVKVDEQRIYQVIYNLANNAINYTGDDKIVTINITEKKKNYLIEIKDTGKGIKKEDLENIWDRYYHSEKKHKRNNYGTGLGLSIVKNILQNHGSKFGVKTSPKGTTFYFELKKYKEKSKK